VARLLGTFVGGDLTVADRGAGEGTGEARRRAPGKTRRRYVNSEYPTVVLRFEDGHEIRVDRGTGKSFEGYDGERIKIIAVYDPTSTERVLIATLRAEEFEEAP
jgi:hypothetical protein